MCAFAAGWALVGCQALGLPDSAGVIVAATTGTGLRVLAIVSDFKLPGWSSDGPAPH